MYIYFCTRQEFHPLFLFLLGFNAPKIIQLNIIIRSIQINFSPALTTQNEKGLKLILTTLSLLTTQELAQDVAARDNVIQLLRSRATLLNNLAQTFKLLVRISLVLADLLGHLDVVLGVLVLHTLNSLLDFCDKVSEATRGNVLADDVIELRNCAGLGVQTTANGTVGANLGVQESDEGGFGASALVGFGFVRSLGKEFDGRESADALFFGQSLCVLGLSVHLGDNNVRLAEVVVGKGFPSRSKALAV